MDHQNYTVEDLVCDESFQRYCLGADEEASKFWETWISSHPEKLALVREAEQLIHIISARQGKLPVQLEHLKDSIRRFDLLKDALQPDQVEAQAPVIPIKRNKVKWMAGMAASVLALVVTGYFLLKPATVEPPVVAEQKSDIDGTGIFTGNAPRKTVVLPDGSVVTLRSNSKIVLAKNFNTGSRELHLSGEAFFDVRSQSIPFIVHTDEVNIEVLGTVFNVCAYPDNELTETSLFRGKVAVTRKGHPEQKVILSPSQKMVYSNKTGRLTGTENPLKVVSMLPDPVSHKAQEIAWVRNRLKIDDEPLGTIAAKLQQWYGIHISFTDEDVKAYRYSGTFESETVVKALEALQLSYPFNFEVKKDSIVISK
ncbi:MAG: DUF4974 domain-containing protein [Chitinophagaceae bacterium]|nr:DUF4974 domain-containing protein [Chitinophagaceae bacterium]